MLFEEESSISEESNGAMLIRKNAYKKQARIDNRDEYFEDSLHEFKLPTENECLLIKSVGLSDTGSIFKYITKQEKTKTLYLSTWIISRENIQYLVSLIEEKKIEKIYFVVSTRLKQLKKSNYAFLVEQFNRFPESVFYKVCNCHAKTFSVETEKNYYTIIGSGNWTENPRIENYIIHNDRSIFDFNKDWITDLLCRKIQKK